MDSIHPFQNGSGGGAPQLFVPNFAAISASEEAEAASAFSPTSITRIAVGLDFTVCVALRGSLAQAYVWGRNSSNCLGLGVSVCERDTPAVSPHFPREAVFAVSAGENFCVYLLMRPGESGGKVYSCGLGVDGRLGYPKKSHERGPRGGEGAVEEGGENESDADEFESDSWFTPKPCRVRFPDRAKISRVCCGASHCLAISSSGTLFAWGSGQSGALGLGDTSSRSRPVKVSIPRKGAFVVHVSAGSSHSLCCLQDGSAWAWGLGANGRLGLGHSRSALEPTLIETLVPYSVAFVAAGEAHSAGLDSRGRLFTWGGGAFFRLGHGEETDMPVPRLVEAFGGVPLTQVSCGVFHTLALSAQGELFSWGTGLALGLGEAGDGLGGFQKEPKKVQGISAPVVVAVAGAYHSVAATVLGDLFCWGLGANGRLGVGSTASCGTPKSVPDLRNRVFLGDILAQISAHLAGRNVTLQPLDASLSRSDPSKGDGANLIGEETQQKRYLSQLSCGAKHCIALTAAGRVWVWGSNEEGQLGLGDSAEENVVFEAVPLDCFSVPIREVACGDSHSLAVATYGTLLSWGSNNEGQLGLGVLRPADSPQGVPGLRGVVRVFAFANYSCCISAASAVGGGESNLEFLAVTCGELFSWGSAESGKLGLGEKKASGAVLSPHKVEVGEAVSACALGETESLLQIQRLMSQARQLQTCDKAEPVEEEMQICVFLGRSHMLALTPRGDVYSWGAGFYGRLGNGSSANSSLPAKVKFPTAVRIVAVAAGSFHSLCLSSEGELWVFGKGESLCSVSNITAPKLFLQVEGPNGVERLKAIAACEGHSLVVTLDGRVYGWGSNESFQSACGKGAAQHLDSPEFLQGLPAPADAVFTGTSHSFARLRTKELFAWGSLEDGRLGVGYKKKKLQQTPLAVIPHWAETGGALLASVEAQGNYEANAAALEDMLNDERILLQPALPESLVNAFISQLSLSSSWGGSQAPWLMLQQLLQQEETEIQPQSLHALENDLVSVLSRELDFVLDLGSKEEELRRLEMKYQTLLIGVALKTKCSLAMATEKCCASLLQQQNFLEDLGFVLQQQPVYLARLLICAKKQDERELVLRVTRQVFYEMENSRVLNLFFCLLRTVGQNEALEVPDLRSFLQPDSSNLIPLLQMYALRDTVLLQFSGFLLDKTQPGSVAAYLASIPDVEFCFTFKELLAKKGLSRLEDASSSVQQQLRRDFHIGFEALKACLLQSILQQLMQQQHQLLPVPLRRLLQQVTRMVYSRGFVVEGDDLRLGIDFCYLTPAIRLLLNGVLAPIFKDSEKYCELVGLERLPTSVEKQLSVVADFLEVLASEKEDGPTLYLILQAKQQAWLMAAEIIRSALELTDDLDVQMLMNLFASHYDLQEHFVSFTLSDLMKLLNMCKKYEGYLNLSAYDSVAKIVEATSNGATPPFSDSAIAEAEAAGAAQSFKVNTRFLLKEKNLVYCSITHAPVPQRLALRQRAEVQGGQRVLSLVLRYSFPDPSDFRVSLQEALRSAPPISAQTPEKLAAEFFALATYVASLENPDFQQAELFEQCATRIQEGMFNRKGRSEIECIRWMAEGILERKKHRKYLLQVQRSLEDIQGLQRQYSIMLKGREKSLSQAIECTQALTVERAIVDAAETYRFPLALVMLKKMMKDEGAALGKEGAAGVAVRARPSYTFKYSVLLQREIVVRATSTFSPELLMQLFVTFSLEQDESWRLSITLRGPAVDQLVGEEIISLEQQMLLQRAPDAATIAVAKTAEEPEGVLVFNCLRLAQALQEIRAAHGV